MEAVMAQTDRGRQILEEATQRKEEFARREVEEAPELALGRSQPKLIEAEGGLVALAAFWAFHGGSTAVTGVQYGGRVEPPSPNAPRDAAERALYELAFDHARNDALVVAAKRAAARRDAGLDWRLGPERWLQWRDRGRSVVVDIASEAAAGVYKALVSTRRR